jgi:hypothetical protein
MEHLFYQISDGARLSSAITKIHVIHPPSHLSPSQSCALRRAYFDAQKRLLKISFSSNPEPYAMFRRLRWLPAAFPQHIGWLNPQADFGMTRPSKSPTPGKPVIKGTSGGHRGCIT